MSAPGTGTSTPSTPAPEPSCGRPTSGITTDPGCNPSTIGITSAATVAQRRGLRGRRRPLLVRARRHHRGRPVERLHRRQQPGRGPLQLVQPAHRERLRLRGYRHQLRQPAGPGPAAQGRASPPSPSWPPTTSSPTARSGAGSGPRPPTTRRPTRSSSPPAPLAGYNQTQSQAIVALDAGTLPTTTRGSSPSERPIADSDWSTTPDPDHRRPGDQLLSVANKNGVLYTFNRNNLAAGPIWQQASRHRRGPARPAATGSIPSGIFANGVLYCAGGHTCHRREPGLHQRLRPGHRHGAVDPPTDQPILGSPAYVNGMIAEVEGSTFEVLERHDRVAAVLLRPARRRLRRRSRWPRASSTWGPSTASSTPSAPAPPPATPPADPTARPASPARTSTPRPRAASQSAGGTLTVTAAGTGIKGTGDQFRLISEPVSGDSQASVTVIRPGPARPGLTQQAGLMVRQTAAVVLALLRRPGLPQRLAPRRPGVGRVRPGRRTPSSWPRCRSPPRPR